MRNCVYCGSENENKLLKYCKNCYYSEVVVTHKVKPYKIKQISDKKKQRLKETGGEKKKFIEIAIKRAIDGNCKCETCGKSIRLIDLTHWNFDHEIPKSRGEEHRLNDDNIKIKCVACHFKKTNGLNLKTNYNN